MVLKNVVVVEGGLKLGGKNIADLVSPYTYLKVIFIISWRDKILCL